MKISIIILLCLSVAIPAIYATKGVDISQAGSLSFMQCIKNGGYSFAIVRGYCSYGAIDNNAKNSLNNAASAGLYHDVYHFP